MIILLLVGSDIHAILDARETIEIIETPIISEPIMKQPEQTNEDVTIPQLSTVMRVNKDAGKKVALTFDDGPTKFWTEKYLAVLNDYQVKATFFLIGEWVEQYPELVEMMVQLGHEIGGIPISIKILSK